MSDPKNTELRDGEWVESVPLPYVPERHDRIMAWCHRTRTLHLTPFIRLPWRGGAWDRLFVQWHPPDRSDWGLHRHGIVRERNWRIGPLCLTWWRLAMQAVVMDHTWEDLVPWSYENGVKRCDYCWERPEDHDAADQSLCIEAHQITLSRVPCPNSNCMAGEVWSGDRLATCSVCHGDTTVAS